MIMRAARFTLGLLGSLASLFGAVGCSNSSCSDNQNSLPLAGFYIVNTDGTDAAVSLSGLGISGVDAPNDSLICGEQDSESQVYLPFRFDRTVTSFRFYSYEADVADTITFSYDAIPYFASEECGAMYRYRITQVSHTSAFIDSVALTDSLITNVDMERIKIYVRVSSDDSDDSDDAENSDDSENSETEEEAES